MQIPRFTLVIIDILIVAHDREEMTINDLLEIPQSHIYSTVGAYRVALVTHEKVKCAMRYVETVLQWDSWNAMTVICQMAMDAAQHEPSKKSTYAGIYCLTLPRYAKIKNPLPQF